MVTSRVANQQEFVNILARLMPGDTVVRVRVVDSKGQVFMLDEDGRYEDV